MNVCVVGLWHLGITTAACLAERGHRVVGVDRDAARVQALADGRLPIVEPDLAPMTRAGLESGRLAFSSDRASSLRDADLVWITYDVADGDAGSSLIVEQFETLGSHLPSGVLVLVSSQVQAGTTRRLERMCSANWPEKAITVAYSPENLRIGGAVESFLQPGRVVIGVGDESDRSRLTELFAPFTDSILWMSIESAEMTKHALNAFLATSVSFINEIAELCEVVGADATDVERGLKSERRIGPRAYLAPGGAYAGGTLDRDIQNLLRLAGQHHVRAHLIAGTAAANDAHQDWVLRTLRGRLGDLRDHRVGVWGLATKPGSDILEASASLDLCAELHAEGAEVVVFDLAVPQLPAELVGLARAAPTPVAAVAGASALVVATGCAEFRDVPSELLVATMRRPLIIDPGRHLGTGLLADSRIEYCAVGRPGRFVAPTATPGRVHRGRVGPRPRAGSDHRPLEGSVCVITGSSRGAGRQIAATLASRGASIALCARSTSELHQAADELRDAHGVDVRADTVDVTDLGGVSHWAETITGSLGPPDAVINNAGVLGPVGRIDRVDLWAWRHALEINVVGAANVCAAFVPSMAERRGGTIINLSGAGIGGPQPPGNMSAYTTAKAGLVVLTETLSEELAPVGISVYAVAPGAMATELMRPVLDAGAEIAGARLHELSRHIYDPQSPAPSQLPSEFVDLLLFLMVERPAWLSGKLLSAKWDSLESLRAPQAELDSTSLLTLRRIDGVLFDELPRDDDRRG